MRSVRCDRCWRSGGYTVAPDLRLRTLAEVVDDLGASGQTGIIDGGEVRVRRATAGHKDRGKFISGKSADVGYQGLGTQTGGRMVPPPHRKGKEEPTRVVRGDS
ncbi:hypothetical protein [Streptomyces sp. PU-14G]|uniref:hypothetical protein n=1 Tax=Streptomyces sp. PU-14G TaxID=2800808 RepID=UPI0034DE8193